MEEATCLDCGRQLSGRFCSSCGQRHGDHDLSLKHVVEEVLEEFLHFDGRLLGTLRRLLFRPGQLTLDYLAGRRSRFLPPFRVYIFVSFVLFLCLGQVSTAPRSEAAKAEINMSFGDSPKAKGRAAAFEAGARRAVADPQAFKEHLLHWGSRVMFLLLPAFAGLLMLFFRGSRRFFVEHVVFSLHFHSFAFGLFLVEWLGGLAPWGAVKVGSDLLIFGLPVYLGIALKRVYGGPTWKIVVKGAVLTGIYLILVLAALAGVVLWVLSR